MARLNLQILLSLLIFTHFCLSFNPSWYLNVGNNPSQFWDTLKALVTDGDPGWGRTHDLMTKDGVTDRHLAYFGIKEASKFMDDARKEIIRGSEVVDEHGDSEAEDGTCHFDDETFQQSNQRLINHTALVAQALANGDISKARNLLGRALHTLQDFYSHSNWVELGKTTISAKLGRSWPLDLPTAGNASTCYDCTYDAAAESKAKKKGSNAHDRAQVVTGTCREEPTCPNDPFTIPCKGRIMACEFLDRWDPDCKSNLYGTVTWPDGGLLTSGWFGTKPKLMSTKPANKCSHGGPFDRDAWGKEGISKDTRSPFISPHWFYHKEAAKLADAATVQYLDDVALKICGPTPFKQCQPLRVLYGVGPVLSFVIDTTTSMTSIIAAVRDDAIQIVNNRRGTADEPYFYVLTEINDPTGPAPKTFTNADSFIEAILKLDVYNMGANVDCAEMGMTGLNDAIKATPAHGKIFVWTDAGAKDHVRAADVKAAAKAKKQEVVVFQFPAGCSDGDTTDRTLGYKEVSRGTGGLLMKDLVRGDSGKTSRIATSLIQDNLNKIQSTTQTTLTTISSGLRKRLLSETDIAVDSTMDYLAITLDGNSTDFHLTRPDGSIVASTDKGMTQTQVTGGLLLTVDSPQVGLWKVSVSSEKEVSLSVVGKSPLLFSRFEFVEPRGGHHEGLFPLKDDPVAGSEVVVKATIEGEHSHPIFSLRSLSGSVISTIDMLSGNGTDEFDAPANDFFGLATIPSESFNIFVTGQDSSGAEFMRMIPGLINTSGVSNTTNSTKPANSTQPSTITTLPSNTTTIPYQNATTTTPVSTNTTSASNHTISTSTNTTTSTAWSAWQIATGTTSGIFGDATTLSRTIVYFSSCPVGDPKSSSWSTTTITTTIAVPCWSNCETPLPQIKPSCTTKYLGSEITTGVPTAILGLGDSGDGGSDDDDDNVDATHAYQAYTDTAYHSMGAGAKPTSDPTAPQNVDSLDESESASDSEYVSSTDAASNPTPATPQPFNSWEATASASRDQFAAPSGTDGDGTAAYSTIDNFTPPSISPVTAVTTATDNTAPTDASTRAASNQTGTVGQPLGPVSAYTGVAIKVSHNNLIFKAMLLGILLGLASLL